MNENFIDFFGDVPYPRHRVSGNVYDLYLVSEIGEASDFVNWFHLIRDTTPQDTIVIHINSPGGDVYTALQLCSAIQETKAHVAISVEGMCASAATILLMLGDSFALSPHASFLFHNYSGGCYGKGNEIHLQAKQLREWSEGIFRDYYNGFLTEEEITGLIEDRDIWMNTNEVIERLEARQALMTEEEEPEPKPKASRKKAAPKTPRKRAK